MFRTLGQFTYRRRRVVALVWLVVLVGGMALSGAVVPRLQTDPGAPPSVESARVAQRVHDLRHHGAEIVAVVDGAPASDPAIRRTVTSAVDDVRATPGVATVLDHYSTGHRALAATDGTASLVVVQLEPDLTMPEQNAAVHAVAERLRAIDAPSVTVGGSALFHHEMHTAIEKDLARGEMRALPIAFVAMIVIFGGLLAAGMPLLIALASVAGAMFAVLAATGVTDVSVYAINVVFMLGIGLGIDYGLLVVSRFREERGAGATVQDAVERSVATAGRTVAFSAATLAVALAGLFAFDDPTFRSFGVAGISVVLISLLAATTLLPALLGMWGRRIKPSAPRSVEAGGFARIARFVQRRAVAVVLVVGLGLALLAAPFLGARFEHGDVRYLPRSSETRAVALTLADRFPARGADPILLAAGTGSDDPALERFTQRLAFRPGVAAVSTWPDTPAGMAIVEVVPDGSSQGPVAQELVRQLRAERPGFSIEVGGVAASLIDTKQEITERLPVAFGIIAVATFVLLFLMTGSVAVPFKAIVMNVLSLGASFGALVWVFQEGHLSGVLGFDSAGSLDLFMPVLIFIFAFGLSMDYEVFLLGRIKEIYDDTGDNDHAVAAGLQRTGKVVTSAALLIVVVFAGFAMGEVLGIKMLGFGLALAVVVDATIVRTLLVPATMKLLGDWNWWAPSPLRRIHERFGLSETTISAPGIPEPSLEQVPA